LSHALDLIDDRELNKLKDLMLFNGGFEEIIESGFKLIE
jgi:hypothetical protein